LQSKEVCLHHQHDVKKNCCIYIHRRKLLVHELCDKSREARVNFVNWYRQAVREGKTNPTRIQQSEVLSKWIGDPPL
jgi:hypothetical protein